MPHRGMVPRGVVPFNVSFVAYFAKTLLSIDEGSGHFRYGMGRKNHHLHVKAKGIGKS